MPGEHKVDDPPAHVVGRPHPDHGDRSSARHSQQQDVAPPHAGQEHHPDPGEQQHHHHAEIRLQVDQDERRRHQDEGEEERHDAAHAVLGPVQDPRQDDDHEHLRQFGGLHREGQHLHPALRSEAGLSNDEGKDQEPNDEYVYPPIEPQEHMIVDRRDDHVHCEAYHPEERLPDDIVVQYAGVVLGRARHLVGAVDHQNADRHQADCHDQRYQVKAAPGCPRDAHSPFTRSSGAPPPPQKGQHPPPALRNGSHVGLLAQ